MVTQPQEGREQLSPVGHEYDFEFGADARYRLLFVDDTSLQVTVLADAGYPAGTINHFDIEMTSVAPGIYMITWIEPATGNTVTHVDDFGAGVAYTNITDLASAGFWRVRGTITRRDS